MKVYQIRFWGAVGFLVFFLSVGQGMISCTEDEKADPTPTPTATSTPTITPTPSPTGNAPFVIYPVDGVSVSDNTITFDWTDAPGSTRYWMTMWIWYPPGTAGTWRALWNELFLELDESEVTLTRDDLWFYYSDESLGWLPGDYAWSVTGNTSTAWSEWGYFAWTQ